MLDVDQWEKNQWPPANPREELTWRPTKMQTLPEKQLSFNTTFI
jgi:hypothetical protein